MNWLQNSTILAIGFLLSQLLIAAKTHHRLIEYFLLHSRSTTAGLLTGTLFLSYALSVFFSNTVVVLVMLPVVRKMLGVFPNPEKRKQLVALFYCALIFGANTGGMASMTGSPLNIAAVGFAEFQAFPGTERLTFFTWLLAGVPLSFLLMLAARWILLKNTPAGLEPRVLPAHLETGSVLPRKPLVFFAGNIALIVVLTAAQFLLSPPPVVSSLNPVDLAFILYLVLVLFFSFLYPRKVRTVRNTVVNVVFLLLFLAAFPLILASKTLEQIETRLRIPTQKTCALLDRVTLQMINAVWRKLFGESFDSLSIHNFNSHLSINRIILEIPWFGLLLMVCTALLLFLILSLGDNPATPERDGILFILFQDFSSRIASLAGNPTLLFSVIGISTIFATELLNNTTVLLLLSPAILAIEPVFPTEQLLLLLVITVSASGAYMSPIATPVNALAFGGLEKLSIKTVLRLGLFMNLVAALMISGSFILLSHVL
ncbi:MAG: hypothetical protein ISR54_01475 [Chlorobium phaeobacteroides]|uniref:Citrate transporter-like domain-containing protein n=1 Tax=Chlorobium phaeobacteroides (strain BS1) TaxID=331678 RepID=B3EQX5_CHLPB|nr:hypothetical protein [Chlorobium phaeobacteroides]MBL6955485.1 hypothetical protein [Chlorobium phaeobacteroides]